MKLKKLFGFIALAAVIGFVMTACPTDSPPNNNPPVTPTDITWTLEQVGGVAGEDGDAATASTTAILIKFSAAVTDLADSHISIGGAATRSDDAISRDGNNWTVPVTVEHSDEATVTVTKSGIEGGQKHVLVYKEGEAPLITYTAKADGEQGSVTSTKITFTFSADVDELEADDITLTDGTGDGGGSATQVTLTADEDDAKKWVLTITDVSEGTISVAIDKEGISATPHEVTVYKEGEAPLITYTAKADGEAGTTTSTKITLTFSEGVTDLDADDITLTPGTGAATKGTLTADDDDDDDTIWELAISDVSAGTVSVKVTKEGVKADPVSVTVHKEGELPTHPIGGKSSWVTDAYSGSSSMITFSDISGTGGTFELFNYDWTDEDWTTPQGEGTYTYNESAETVTITLTKVGMMDNETLQTVLKTKTEAEAEYRTTIEAHVEDQIAYYMEELVWDEEEGEFVTIERDEDEAEAYFLEMEHEWNGKPNYQSKAAYIAGELEIALEVFDPRPYTYFTAEGTLVLLEALPASGGSNELSGKTFTLSGFEGGEAISVDFNADGTFSATMPTDDEITIPATGTYSYNSTKKLVYAIQDQVDGQTPEEFFNNANVEDYSNFPAEADDRAAQTNRSFRVTVFIYDTTDNSLSFYGN